MKHRKVTSEDIAIIEAYARKQWPGPSWEHKASQLVFRARSIERVTGQPVDSDCDELTLCLRGKRPDDEERAKVIFLRYSLPQLTKGKAQGYKL
jgi:hypothetical protein